MASAVSPSTSSSSTERNPNPLLHSAARCVHSLTASILSQIPFSPIGPTRDTYNSRSKQQRRPPSTVTVPFLLPSSSSSYSGSWIEGQASPSSTIRSFSSSVRVDGHGSSGKERGDRGGPAFVGQVFSMLDPSGIGLMAVTTHFNIPFIRKMYGAFPAETPLWLKRIFSRLTEEDQNGPVFRFFMDLSDAVTYVRRLNVPNGKVGACRLDIAYEHFKEKPHMFRFVPNKKQVKAANKLLRTTAMKGGRTKVHGVPVFTAENLNIAIASTDGIKWYTPYFFDKNLLDNILEASVDQHFHALIQNRRMQRRHDVVDGGLTSEMIEENIDNLFEPPEVQELMDEMGHQGIPLSVISKAAEIQVLDVVDRALLGNKWLRKATGIQPKLPYLVDSFEERTAACFQPAPALSSSAANPKEHEKLHSYTSNGDSDNSSLRDHVQSVNQRNCQFPFGNWFSNRWSNFLGTHHRSETHIKSNSRIMEPDENGINGAQSNPLLPKITMVGISMGEGGHSNRASVKKTMEDLTKELEQANQTSGGPSKDKDPLFVANVGGYSSITRISSA
ncbi:hypothetical protein AXF42_Ash020352 [Apostasia shenzhenica]|uniref:Tic22-like family protein n=1 Tax=Apostasia shenzhenica TaxID=1088818 RepID=A0A2I0BA97_9ASPA|nr:hypothetical protein AXF42_Ash020352 [Apostasia shenzhenica]